MSSKKYGGPYSRRKSAYRALTTRPQIYQPRDYTRGRIESSSSGGVVRMIKNVFLEDYFAAPLLTGNGYNLVFKVNDITNWSNIAAIYDQYKINWVSVAILPKVTAATGSTIASGTTVPSTQVQCGLIHTAIDYDLGGYVTTAASGAALAVYDTYKYTRGTNVHKRVFKPQAADVIVLAPGGSTSTAGMLSRNMWIDSSQGALQHYGLKIFIDDWESFGCNIDVVIKYSISLRNCK